MKINITNTFTKSLNKFIMMETWWYKTYSFFRWDLWKFLSNVWKFRKELYEHSWWDYHFTLHMLRRSVSIMEKGMHRGLEVRVSRDKKIQKMQRLLELLDNKIEDKYIEIAETELGYELVTYPLEFEDIGNGLSRLLDTESDEEKAANRLIFDKSKEIEEREWNEIWEILKGQPISEYIDIVKEKKLNNTYNNQTDYYNDWFDGTGLRGWWD